MNGFVGTRSGLATLQDEGMVETRRSGTGGGGTPGHGARHIDEQTVHTATDIASWQKEEKQGEEEATGNENGKRER